MKKLVILPLIAVVSLGLVACHKQESVDNTTISSDADANSVDALGEANLTTTDETVADNALDGAGDTSNNGSSTTDK